MFAQILWGSLLLGICAIIHIGILVITIPVTKRVSKKVTSINFILRSCILILTVLAFIILSHTLQVWFWAFWFILLGALGDLEQAIYFSLVTYTTVGYGDLTLTSDYRIFAAMASVTGLLTFGLSTAFLVTFFERIRPKE